MPPYLTAEKMVKYLPQIEVGLVEKLRDFRRHESFGTSECGDKFAQLEFAMSDYKYFANKYIPAGTIFTQAQSATAIIDFSSFDVIILGNNLTGNLVINFLDGSTLTLVGINGSFAGYTLDQFLDFLVTRINTVSGWSATHTTGQDYITITCPDTLGDTINRATVTLSYGSGFFLNITRVIDKNFKLADVINNPSSNKHGYTIGITTQGPTSSQLVLIFDSPTNSFQYLIPGTTMLGSSEPSCAYNPSSDLLYIMWTDAALFYARAAVVDFDPVTNTASHTFITLPAGVYFTNSAHKAIYNAIDQGVYFMCSNTSIGSYGFLRMFSDLSFNFLSCNTAIPITRPSINTETGAIIYVNAADTAEEVSMTGVITVIYPPGSGYFVRSTGFYNVGGTWKYLLFLINGPTPLFIQVVNSDLTLGSTYNTPIPYPNTASVTCDFLDTKKLLTVRYTSGSTNLVDAYTFNLNTPVALWSFGVGAAVTLSYTLWDFANQRYVFGKSGNVQLGDGDLYYVENNLNSIDLEGMFEGGVTEVEWLEGKNCLTDAEANHQFDQLLMWLGISDCGENTLSEQTSIEELLSGERLLGTHTGIFITTATGAYIRIL